MAGRNRIAIAGVGLLAGFSSLALGSAVMAQEAYPPAPEESLAVSQTTLEPGESLTVTGTGFDPGSTVEVVLRSVERSLAATTADGSGSFSLDVTIPCGTEPGAHNIVSKGQDPSLVPFEQAAAVTVTDQPCRPVSFQPGTDGAGGAQVGNGPGNAAANIDAGRGGGGGNAASGNQGGGQLPRTGSSSLVIPLAIVALVAVALGSVAVMFSRRARSTGSR